MEGERILVSHQRGSKSTTFDTVVLDLRFHIFQVEPTVVVLCVAPPDETGGLPLTHYELRIQPGPTDRFHGPFAYLSGRRFIHLPDLMPNHFYRFALSAVTSAGRGPNTYIEVSIANSNRCPFIFKFSINAIILSLYWRKLFLSDFEAHA